MMRILGVILVVLCPLCDSSECQSLANMGFLDILIAQNQSWAQFTKNFTTEYISAGRIWCARKRPFHTNY